MEMAKEYTEEEFAKWLEHDFSESLQKKVKLAIKTYTAKITQEAVDNAPIDTGYLAGSINYRISEDGFESEIFVGAEYGIYVEFGTVHKEPRPFFYKAYNKYIDRYLKLMDKYIIEALAED